MHFRHSSDIWRDFPALSAGILHAEGIHRDVSVNAHIAAFEAAAKARLAASSEGEFPEIQAWRRAFSRLGLKPTQYRSASEALLRRFRKDGSLPRIHPVIDLFNAASLAFAIPIAVFDLSKVVGHLEVRYASDSEIYTTFSGETEHPEQHEVIFADEEGRAHARRWTNRQSGYSAVGDETTAVLIVAEALHVGAATDVGRLVHELAETVGAVWAVTPRSAVLDRSAPRFDI
ncbi:MULTISPECIES: phenylalanine--tRNA ligase beta subunit-related protein [unclassified Sinorhizobium]|uniref:B3/B4 domain-containing protein n=1 Tax=unclassified Sinorhizobium TaxID=2613772 RepID=UPI0024C27E58|nr:MULTISPECIES: phenylalanine--tRNA ligase beta subunit-related protein [unclassified Sinorhizobium]MDK1376934.1 phenylalanine--tRNA ligase beta subunit-related protein [Sinorhizobium sp. 6-70]MDK1479237.1 phenylalanine--tRNA ligase beta subunit-related protein [Sinorhizobium sp. 6-117]